MMGPGSNSVGGRWVAGLLIEDSRHIVYLVDIDHEVMH